MSIAPISSTVQAPAYTPPPQQAAKASEKAASTDTVTISKQAVQKLASDGDTTPQELRENGAEKAREAANGKA